MRVILKKLSKFCLLSILQISHLGVNSHLPRKLLRDTLTNGCVTMQWQNEDIVRTKFRLSLVVRARERPEEASTILEEIASSLEAIRPVSIQSTYTDEDDMKLLDFGISIFHGRTAGIWSNGTFW
jgi:hypothetical protein